MIAKGRIIILQGDITDEKVDAIVNAANTDLLLGSGVAGAIRRRGGDSIQAECDRHGAIPLGGAALTGGGNLPTRHVIHAAAMRLGEAPTAESIRDATRSSLDMAAKNNLSAISFPALGTGMGGFSMKEAADIMLSETMAFMATRPCPAVARFVLFDESARKVFSEVLEQISWDFGV